MKGFRVKIILISSTIIYLTIRYLTTSYSCIDFPCFYELQQGQLKTDFIASDSLKDLLVFISDFPEHASGGGCFSKSVIKGKPIDYANHQIKLTDNGLLIDNKIHKVGDSIFNAKWQIKPINLWWIYHYEFKLKNLGQVYSLNINDSIINLEYPRFFVAGYESTKEEFNYITIVIYLGFIASLIYLIIRERK